MRHNSQRPSEFEVWMKRSLPEDSDWVPMVNIEEEIRPTYIPRSHLKRRKISRWDVITGFAAIGFAILYFGRFLL